MTRSRTSRSRRRLHPDQRDAPRSTCSSRSDSGSSMIEVLIAVVLLGMVVAAVFGGLSLSIGLSSRTTSRAKSEALIASASDRLAAAAYIACPATSGPTSYLPTVQAAASAVGWPASTVQITKIEYWQPTSASAGSWSSTSGLSAGECSSPGSLTTTRTLQRLTLSVRSPDSRYTRTLEVVKTNVVSQVT